MQIALKYLAYQVFLTYAKFSDSIFSFEEPEGGMEGRCSGK